MDWEKEYKKCIGNPYYFYTTYVLVNGKQATTMLSKEEFNKYFEAKRYSEWWRKTTPKHIQEKMQKEFDKIEEELWTKEYKKDGNNN